MLNICLFSVYIQAKIKTVWNGILFVLRFIEATLVSGRQCRLLQLHDMNGKD